MASSLLALLDDIATILDDVAAMTKVATKKTAGVLGDDLALNAEQVTGVRPERELSVVWAVAKGSAINKLILVPSALAISVLAPWAVTPLLMIGGLFLCFEGFEKVVHKLLHSKEADSAHHKAHLAALAKSETDVLAVEKDKIKGAVRTDFILSAEIIVISLGTVASAPMGKQFAVLTTIAVIMTVGVYGLVAGIVKLDDLGLALSKRDSGGAKTVGRAILKTAPYLMKGLSIAGTAAMFLVGGGIVVHGIPGLEPAATAWFANNSALAAIGPTLLNAIVGVVSGGLVLAVVTLGKKLLARKA